MARPHALRTCTAVLALAAALVAEEKVARAEPSLDLTWTAPPGCPDRAWMMSAVLHLVTGSPPQALLVTGAVHEEDGQWVVDLELSGAASGTRTLRASSCKSVSRGAALIVALALDPQAAALASEELARSEAPAPPPPSPAPPPPPPEAPPAPARVESPGIRPIVFAGPTATRALLPGVAPGMAVGGGIVWRSVRVDLAGELVPRSHTSLARVPAVGADLSLAALALRACVGHAFPWLAAHGCTALRGARIAGQGTGLAESYRQTAHVLTLEPGVLLRVPGTTRAAVELEAAPVLPLTRPDFVILSSGPSEPLFRVSSAGIRVAGAASFRF